MRHFRQVEALLSTMWLRLLPYQQETLGVSTFIFDNYTNTTKEQFKVSRNESIQKIIRGGMKLGLCN